MSEFDFGGDSVARTYEEVLVRRMFGPWAGALLDEFDDWDGRTVLDLATGTGVVARQVAERVGPGGRVIGADLNGEMLKLARARSTDVTPAIEFVECSADALELSAASIDVAVCQQGFQFFPDRGAAARELERVLVPGGHILVSTWCPTGECVFWDWVCQALAQIGEPGIEALLRLPFDHMPQEDLASAFVEAGFIDVLLARRAAPLVLPGGIEEAVTMAYATPIAPHLRALPEERRDLFHRALSQRVTDGSPDGATMGDMAAHVLRATKPAA
jgi:ubiquinone/menaquinone biosynthesis C-methylase UbiE